MPCKRNSVSIGFIEVENPNKGSILCEKKLIISKISRIEGRSENIEDREVGRSKDVNKKIFRVLRAGIRLKIHRSLHSTDFFYRPRRDRQRQAER